MKEFIHSLFVVLLSSQVVLSGLLRIPDADDFLHIYALPVGQGDCTVIQCPRDHNHGNKGLVSIIDAGASNREGMGKQQVFNFLFGTHLNLVLTHSDRDHLAYIDYILEGYGKHVNVFHSCCWKSYKVKSKFARPVQIGKCGSIKECGVTLSLCRNAVVTLSVVASAFGDCKDKRAKNEDSIISKITYAGVSTLISGDFEGDEKFMAAFLAKGGADIKSDIYRLCHHGAYNKKANTEAFLNAVGAKYVFSSSGYGYKHPRCEVYNYYNDRLVDGVVPVHPYTCFRKNGQDFNINTSKAIYVTSLIKKDSNGNWVKSFYAIKFDIDFKGAIAAQVAYVGP